MDVKVGRVYRDSDGMKRTVVEVRDDTGRRLGSGYVVKPWNTSEAEWQKAIDEEAQRIQELAEFYAEAP